MSAPSHEAKWRLRIGSAAIFWAILALVIWIGWYFVLRQDRDEVRLFFAWYFARPALLMVPLALLVRNLSSTNVYAWLVTVPVFLLVGYLFIINLFFPFFGKTPCCCVLQKINSS
jgi:hypothetical protein